MAKPPKKGSQQKVIDVWIIPLILIVGIIFIFAYRKFLVADAIHYGDVTPFPRYPQYLLSEFIYTWNPVGIGHGSNADLNVILKAFYLTLTNNPVLAQQLYLFLPLPVSALFMYILLSHFTNSKIARYIGSIIYAINPQVTYGGPPGPWVQAYSTFPIITFFLIKMFESQKFRQSAIYTLLFSLSFAFAFIYTFEVIFVLAFPIFIIVLSSIILQRNWKYAGKAFLSSGGGIFLAFMIVAAYVLPFLTVSSQVLSPVAIEGYLNDLYATYSYANVQNLMSISYLAWNPFGYNQPGIVAASGLILPLLAFSSLFLITNPKKKKYMIYFATLAVVVIGFNWLLHLKLSPIIALIRQFPFLLVWRAPKATYLAPLAYCPLIALSLDEILRHIPKLPFLKNKKSYIVAITAMFLFLILTPLAIYNWPIVTGDVGVSYFHYPTYSTPPSFYKIAQWIDQHRASEGFFRTLWLPWSPDVRNMIVSLDPYHFGMPQGVEIAQSARFENSYLVAATFTALYNRTTDRIGLLLALANVKYIIVSFMLAEYPRGTKADLQLGGDFWLGGDPDVIVDVLQKQRDLSLVEYNDEYAIFENMDWYPYLQVSSNAVLFMDTGTESFVKLQEGNGSTDNVTITNLRPNQKVELYDYDGTLKTSVKAAASNVTLGLDQSEFFGYIKILENEETLCESSIFKIPGGDVYGYTSVMSAKNPYSSLLSVSEIPNFNLQNYVILFKSELSATQLKSILKEVKTIICVGLKEVTENIEILKETSKDQKLLILYKDDEDYQILKGQKEFVKDFLASRGYAIKIGESGQLSVPIHIFRDDYYRIIIRGSPSIFYTLSGTINGNKISFSPLQLETYSWFQTSPLNLETGIYALNLTLTEKANILLDQILIVNSLEESEIAPTSQAHVVPIVEPENLSDWSSYLGSLSLSNDTSVGSYSVKMQTESATGDASLLYDPPSYWNWSEMDCINLWLKYSKSGTARFMLFGEVNGTKTWRHWDFELQENQWSSVTLPLKVAFTAQSEPPFSPDYVDYIWIAMQNLMNENVTLQVTNIGVSELVANNTGTFYTIFSESNSSSPAVDHVKISPVEVRATISAASSVFVNFGETFNKGWEGWQNASEVAHFKVNGYGNGYYIDSKEPVMLVITFAPQQFRNLILLTDALITLAIVALIPILLIDRNKLRHFAHLLRIKESESYVESSVSHETSP